MALMEYLMNDDRYKTVIPRMRSDRLGKSYLNSMMLEMALSSGKKVLVATPEGSTVQYRVKHLTVIETVQEKPPQYPSVVIDDLEYYDEQD